MIKIIHKILYILAKTILLVQKPQIIGVTGSIGKTSTKDAINTVLSSKFNVRSSVKNFNNQLGVPFTIIGVDAPGKNVFKWLWVFLKGLSIILWSKDYPQILVLEMGADRPGDIKYLTKMAPAKIGVVTAMGSRAPAHIEFFKDKEDLIREKRYMVSHLKKDSIAILNADDKDVLPMQEKTKAQVITIGFGENALVKATDLNIDDSLKGSTYKVHYQGNIVPIFLYGALGQGQAYATLFAVAVGLIYGMNLVEISEALKKYRSPVGRNNLISGIKNTLILDSSYNSSPSACQDSLELLHELKITGRRLACLGDMLELGEHTVSEHKRIGKLVSQADIAELYTVGSNAKIIAQEAEKLMGEERVFTFNNSQEAGLFIQDRLHEGDCLLVKGSQGSRVERVVKELMANPEEAKKLLVRQEEGWL